MKQYARHPEGSHLSLLVLVVWCDASHDSRHMCNVYDSASIMHRNRHLKFDVHQPIEDIQAVDSHGTMKRDHEKATNYDFLF